MSQKMEIAFGLIILLGVILGFVLSLTWSQPTQAEVQAKRTVKEIKVPENVLSLDIAKKIQTLEINGQVPVTVAPGDIGRVNPFTPY